MINKDFLKDTFIKYVKIESAAKSGVDKTPSTDSQLHLAKIIAEDLKKMGIEDVECNENAYVIARIKGNTNAPTIAFVAHLDTYEGVSGKDVKPIIHENYDGKDITLPKNNTVIKVEDFPYLKKQKGLTLITSDGSTLLGGDDKAGIAACFELAKFLLENKDFKHGDVCLVFTPDEEIGHGASLLDIKKLNAKYAYTLDGEGVGGYTDETFSADSITVKCTGLDIHPGVAKDQMINSVRVASAFIEALPLNKRPETTEGREGFIHPMHIEGNTSETTIKGIVRDFTVEGLEKLEEIAKNTGKEIEKKFKGSKIELEFKKQYRNLKYKLDEEPRCVEYLIKAISEAGLEPKSEPARGGTDGSQLSYRGLLTPNFFSGMYAVHGTREWVCLEHMSKACEVLRNLVKLWANERQ